jgi:hypothetical protein
MATGMGLQYRSLFYYEIELPSCIDHISVSAEYCIIFRQRKKIQAKADGIRTLCPE